MLRVKAWQRAAFPGKFSSGMTSSTMDRGDPGGRMMTHWTREHISFRNQPEADSAGSMCLRRSKPSTQNSKRLRVTTCWFSGSMHAFSTSRCFAIFSRVYVFSEISRPTFSALMPSPESSRITDLASSLPNSWHPCMTDAKHSLRISSCLRNALIRRSRTRTKLYSRSCQNFPGHPCPGFQLR